MAILKCLVCGGEIEIVDTCHHKKKVKCKKCGFNNLDVEVEIIKRRN